MPHIFRIANLESCAPESIPVPPDNVSVRVDWDRGHECVATVEALTLKDLWAYVYPTWIDGSRWEEVLRPSEITLHYGNAEDVTAFGGVVRHYGVTAEFVDDLVDVVVPAGRARKGDLRQSRQHRRRIRHAHG